jgi:hypothetical protein
MKSKSVLSADASKPWRAASRRNVTVAGDGWFATAADLAFKFGPDVFMPVSTTCAVIHYNRTEWALLLFVFCANASFLGYRYLSRKSFGL